LSFDDFSVICICTILSMHLGHHRPVQHDCGVCGYFRWIQRTLNNVPRIFACAKQPNTNEACMRPCSITEQRNKNASFVIFPLNTRGNTYITLNLHRHLSSWLLWVSGCFLDIPWTLDNILNLRHDRYCTVMWRNMNVNSP
jgi:hypothetical protein